MVDSDMAIAEIKSATRAGLPDVGECTLTARGSQRSAEMRSAGGAGWGGAVVDLELMGPVRTARVGPKGEKEPAPPRVRERVNRLQHSLTGQATHRGEVDQRGSGRGQRRDP